MIDVESLKEIISQNPSFIGKILENSGYYNINNSRSDEVRCSLTPDGNNTRVRVVRDTLASSIFGTSIAGDIVTLVMYQLDVDFKQALGHIASILGLSQGEIAEYKPKPSPFGKFFDEVSPIKKNVIVSPPKVIDESIYKKFLRLPSKQFYDDGVGILQQWKYGIAYDKESERIVIPYRNLAGKLVGIEGRLNRPVDKWEAKYLPIVIYEKSKVLFGYYQNYNAMVDSKVTIVYEGAKSVMKSDMYGYDFAVATGSSRISRYQCNMIRNTNCNVVIIAMDEGVEQSHLEEQALKLKESNGIKEIDVGYIYDKDNVILKKGSKDSPADVGKDDLDYLINNCIIWI